MASRDMTTTDVMRVAVQTSQLGILSVLEYKLLVQYCSHLGKPGLSKILLRYPCVLSFKRQILELYWQQVSLESLCGLLKYLHS